MTELAAEASDDEDPIAEIARLRTILARQQRQLDVRGEKIVTLRQELGAARASLASIRTSRAYRTALALRDVSAMRRSPHQAMSIVKRVPRSIKRRITR